MVQLNLFIKQKQTHRHRKQIYDYQRGEVGGGINSSTIRSLRLTDTY